MPAMKLLQHLTDGQVYADPLHPAATCRFKTTSAPKVMDGVRLINYVTEIILNDINPVTIGDKSANDAISIRLRVSGSAASQTRIRALMNSISDQYPVWGTENVFLGFEPATPPVNP